MSDSEQPASEIAARKQGWTPKEDFKGDEDKWVDAETFVERGKEINSILRKNNERLEEKLERMSESVEKFSKYHEETEKRAYENAKKDLEKQAVKAVEEGDVEAYTEIKQQQDDLVAPEMEQQQVSNDAFNDWLKNNQWYSNDRELQIMADGYGQLCSEQGLSGESLYAEVSKRVMARAPDKFGKKESQQSVEEGSAPPKQGGKSFSDLPKDAQSVCKEFMRDIPGFTEKQYLKDYDWETL